MIEERSIRLLDALEGRTDTLLGLLQRERDARLALEQRLAEREAAHRELGEKHHELAEAHRELEEKHLELAEERRELVEENRELDAQNRELEEHNRRLHERLNHQAEGQGTGFPRPARRSQGLSALIGRHSATPTASGATITTAADDVGARFIGDHADAAADANAKSPMCRTTDKSGSYNAAATTGDVGARLVGRSAEGTDAAKSPMCRTTDKSGSYNAAATTGDVGARLVGRSAEGTDAAATTDAPSPHALLAEWYQRYPGAFFKGHTRPLKVGIHEALAEQEPWPEKLVRRALACYVNLPRYLKAVREGAERIGLDGKPAGQVDTKAAEHARKKLERLQAEGRGKGRAASDQPRRANSKGKPGRGQASGRGAAGKGASGKRTAGEGAAGQAPAAAQAAPGAESGQPARTAPATMEEKLAALVAKHRQR
ncbi:ProQ/FINO family protein [Halomonas mongoliensis]|uniref:ProQ/FINO family protein n=1 Tax=Halomonas mongoliensis TaxID=321265 RepID=UPI00403A8FE7